MSSIIIRCWSLFTLKLFLVKWFEFTLLKLCRVLFEKLFHSSSCEQTEIFMLRELKMNMIDGGGKDVVDGAKEGGMNECKGAARSTNTWDNLNI